MAAEISSGDAVQKVLHQDERENSDTIYSSVPLAPLSDTSTVSIATTSTTPIATADERDHPVAALPDGMEIVHGEPIVDRKSTFQAHAVEICSQEQVYTCTRTCACICTLYIYMYVVH